MNRNINNPEPCNRADEGWLQKYWRPMMAVVYMAIILFDFIIAPVFWSMLQVYAAGTITLQWAPLTLISGGLFHAAMGAVLGVTAFMRGQEKIERLRKDYQEGGATLLSDADDNEPTRTSRYQDRYRAD
jgi:hypothetical protein